MYFVVYGDGSSAFLLQESKGRDPDLVLCGVGAIEIWAVEYLRKGHSLKI